MQTLSALCGPLAWQTKGSIWITLEPWSLTRTSQPSVASRTRNPEMRIHAPRLKEMNAFWHSLNFLVKIVTRISDPLYLVRYCSQGLGMCILITNKQKKNLLYKNAINLVNFCSRGTIGNLQIHIVGLRIMPASRFVTRGISWQQVQPSKQCQWWHVHSV